jgi:arylsulfatase A-like enzyme
MHHLSGRAGILNTAAIAVAIGFILSQTIAAAVVGRYGQWVFTAFDERLVLHGFMASAGILCGVLAGLGMWVGLQCVGFASNRFPRVLLITGSCIMTVAWLVAMFDRWPLHVYRRPMWLVIIALSFFMLLAFVKGKRPWLVADVVTLDLSFVALMAMGVWLNFSFIRQAASGVSSWLNSLTLLGAQAACALGLGLASRGYVRNLDPVREARTIRPAVQAAVLLGIAIVAAAAAVPMLTMVLIAERAGAGQSAGARVQDLDLRAEKTDLPVPNARNLVLISIDTLRADHLGLYGYGMSTSPNIDRFFADGVVFGRAYSQTPWTLPSHVSMLTGLYPSTHGVRIYPTVTRGFVDQIPKDVVLISEILSAEGFTTAGFTGGAYLTKEYAFDRGFSKFQEADSMRMVEVLDSALPWLSAHAAEPFFLFLHSFDVHRFNPPHVYEDLGDGAYRGSLWRIREENPEAIENLAVGDGFYSLGEEDLGFLVALYDSEIRDVDRQLERLFSELERLELLENTAVVFTSDHGESFFEHRTTGHAFTLYGPALHVPLLVRTPGANHRVVLDPVQSVDLAPTILDILEVPARSRPLMQGTSLVSAIAGSTLGNRPIVCEADVLDTQAALYSGRYKYINYGVLSHSLFDRVFILLTLKGLLSPYAQNEELFDLRDDPGETANLASSDPKRTEELRSVLFQRVRAFRQMADARGSRKLAPSMSRELEEKLKALGYTE